MTRRLPRSDSRKILQPPGETSTGRCCCRRRGTAEADVALRTFSNYFSSKCESIRALGADRAQRIGAELLARPPGEPLREAITSAMLADYDGADQAPSGEWMSGLRLVLTSPPIRGEYLKVTAQMQEALAEAIAARTGTGISQDMYPQILAGAVTAAAQGGCRSGWCLGW